jgi:2-methylcitrate dehydratase
MLTSRHVVDTAPQTNNSGVDQLLADIADYVVSYDLQSPDAVKNARYSLLDALGAFCPVKRLCASCAHRSQRLPAPHPPGCALLALSVPEARTLLGPVVPGAHGGVHGCHVPGTCFSLDPVSAAFSTGALVSWLDYNDCWLGAEWCGQ